MVYAWALLQSLLLLPFLGFCLALQSPCSHGGLLLSLLWPLSCSCFGLPSLIWTHRSPMPLYFVTLLFPQALAIQHPGHSVNGFPGSCLLSTSWDLANALRGSPEALSSTQCPADPGWRFPLTSVSREIDGIDCSKLEVKAPRVNSPPGKHACPPNLTQKEM